MKNNYKISVIIPTYNRREYIEETLNSLKNQTYRNWECIVVDDNSNEKTLKIIKKCFGIDNRFKLIIKSKKLKKGPNISKNIGLEKAKGDFIQFLDSDDILAPNKFEEQIKIIENKEDKFDSVLTCKWKKFKSSKEKKEFPNSGDFKSFKNPLKYFKYIGNHGGFYPPHVFLTPKKLIEKSGYFNKNIIMNDDGEFFSRVLFHCNSLLFTDKTYVLYREHSQENVSSLNSFSKAIDLIYSWKIIEANYNAKFGKNSSNYIEKKKEAVFNSIRRFNLKLIFKEFFFFRKQIYLFILNYPSRFYRKLKLKLKLKFQ